MSNKRPRAEFDNGTTPHAAFLTEEQVTQLSNTVTGHRDVLLSWLSNEKDTDRKKELRCAINGFCDAFQKILCAYNCKLAVDDVVDDCKSALSKACDSIEKVSAAISSKLSSEQNNDGSTQRTYASVAKLQGRIHPEKVILDRGKPIPISTATRVVIGPREDAAGNFSSAKDTKDKFLESVDPVELGLQIKRVNFTTNNQIAIEADNIDINALRNSSSLLEVGL